MDGQGVLKKEVAATIELPVDVVQKKIYFADGRRINNTKSPWDGLRVRRLKRDFRWCLDELRWKKNIWDVSNTRIGTK